MLYTNVVALEGPDCSGKTTLYNEIHKKTNYKWNIRDRSFLSTLCYARQYKRDTDAPRRGLRRELLNLNNRIVVIMPSQETVLERLRRRGDEFQDETSIVDLLEIFREEVENIRDFPNVFVVEEDLSQEELVEKTVLWLDSFDKMSEINVGRMARDATVACGGEATIDMSLVLPLKKNFSDVMIHPREGKYYEEILSDTTRIIENELAGDNPYGTPQGFESRRFYYSSSSCLSSVHFLFRNELLNVRAVLRSTDVHRNAAIDTKFLCHLSKHVCEMFFSPTKKIELDVRFNCAHVRKDLPAWTKNEVFE